MKKITKGNPPNFWVSFIKKNPKVTYQDLFASSEGQELRNQLRNYLAQEQGYICGYCCSVLSDRKSHNEHIRPESVYTKLTMDYNNIIVSCTQVQHSTNSSCGMQKDDEYNERLFVSPLEDDCARHFKFYPNGSIDSGTDRGKYTIELLRLHESRSLRENRRKQYEAVYYSCSKEVIELCDGISERNGADYLVAKELYQDFFNTTVIPDYFSKKNGVFPAYIDMLEYFKEMGEFDFDSIVTDLALSGQLQFDIE